MRADLNKSPNQMWEEIQPIYEFWYKVKFKKRPNDEQIKDLYKNYLLRMKSTENFFKIMS